MDGDKAPIKKKLKGVKESAWKKARRSMKQTQFDRSSKVWDEDGKMKLDFELMEWDRMTGFKVKVIKEGFGTVEPGILWYVGKDDVTMSPQKYLDWNSGGWEVGVCWSGTGRKEFVKLSEIHWCLGGSSGSWVAVWDGKNYKKKKRKAFFLKG